MPIGPFPDFNACVAHMMKLKEEGGGGYDEETAKKVCGKLKAELEESFSWASDLEVLKPYRHLIHGKAIHPVKTYHPCEWPQLRVYLEEELKKSAETLIGKPLFLDHVRPLNGSVLGAHYEDGALEYIARVEDEDALRMIHDGQIKHASVQFEWKSLENVNGVAPRGINFEHLSLLHNMEPGDPLSSVEIWESIARQLKEAKANTTNTLGDVRGKESMDHRRKEAIEAKVDTTAKDLAPPNPGKGSETEKSKMNVLTERIWDRAYINALPDESFALIQSGGEKDETGRTKPRSLRRLPHHRADGSLDLPHLRNALARAPQMKDVSEEERNKAISHLQRHAKALGIGAAEESKEPFKHPWKELNEVEFQVAPEPTMEELIESIEDVVEQINGRLDAIETRLPPSPAQRSPTSELEDLKARVHVLESQKATLQEEVKGVKKPGEAVISSNVTSPRAMIPKKAIEAVLPPDWIARAWGLGPQRLVQDIKRLLRQSWEA